MKYSFLIFLLACILQVTANAGIKDTNAVFLTGKIKRLHRQVADSVNSYPEAALRLAKEEELLSRQLGDESYLLQSYIDLSACYRFMGRFSEAMRFGNLSLEKAAAATNDTLTAAAYANMGNLFFKKGLHDSATVFLIKSLKLREKLGLTPEIIQCLYNLGAISNSLGDAGRALDYFNSALQMATAYREPGLLALAYEGMASYHYSRGDHDKAIDAYLEAEKLYTRLGNWRGKAQCLVNLGSLSDEKGLSKESIGYYTRALHLFEELNLEENILSCYANLGITYAGMNQPEQALPCYKKAEAMAGRLGALEALRDIYENIADIYREKKNADSALAYFEKFTLVKDSLLDAEKIKNIEELQEKYNTEKKEGEVRTLKEQQQLKDAEMTMHKKRNAWLLTAVALLAAVALLVFLIFRQRTRNARALTEKNEQLYRRRINEIIKEQELKSINSIMEGQENERKRIAEDLHDRLGSMLATIKLHFNAIEHKMDTLELKNLEQYNRANKLLDEVCDEVRKIAHNMESGVLVNFGLVHALTDLKDALQQSSPLVIGVSTFGMHARLGAEIEISMYRVIQELLSNVIKHAKATEVNIDLNRSATQLTIIFSDNGQGYDPEAAGLKNGMGLKNILSRVNKLGGKFYVDSGKKNGTTTIIEIPLGDDQTADS